LSGDEALRVFINACHERAYLLDPQGVILALNGSAAQSLRRPAAAVDKG